MSFKSYNTRYITKDWKTKILEGDKVIIKYDDKVFTCFITSIGRKYFTVRNGVYKYIKHRHRDGMAEQWLNAEQLEIANIQSICKYPKFTQDESVYVSTLNWKCK